MNLYYNQNYKGDILLNKSEIPQEISEKEQVKDNRLVNISNIYKKKELLSENIKDKENINLQNTDTNITIKETSNRKDIYVNSFNNNLSYPRHENKDINKLKEKKNPIDILGEKINVLEDKSKNEINKSISLSNMKEEKKEIRNNNKLEEEIQLVLKNEESLKIINNCLIEEQQLLNEFEKSIEITYQDTRNQPFDYPIY